MVSDNVISPTYFEAAYEHQNGGCSLTYLNNRDYSWSLKNGKRLTGEWPDGMTFSMNPERPKDKALLDYVHNLEGMVVASPRLVAFLRERELPDLEFLPVNILDHKGRVTSKDYAIINCFRVVDCVDQQTSEFKWDGLENPSMVVTRMALRIDALGPDDRIIRPKFVPGRVLYRSDVREALHAQSFSGLGFTRELFGDFDVYW